MELYSALNHRLFLCCVLSVSAAHASYSMLLAFVALCCQAIVDQRLMETEDNWRLVYKALLLLEYLCKQGPMVGVSDTAYMQC